MRKGSKTINVGTASAQAGAKARGVIKVAYKADGTQVEIPVIIINGVNEGPTLWIDACIHGDEFEGLEAILRVTETLDPNAFSGAVVAVPVVNPPVFQAGSMYSPIDHLNLNRCFPGRPNGPLSEQLAYVYLKEVLSKATYLLDLHSAGMQQLLVPSIVFTEVGSDVDKKVLDLAKTFGVDILWRAPYPAMITTEASRRGLPAICPVVGSEGRCVESCVQTIVKGIMNVMKYYGMLEGEPDLPSSWTMIEGGWIYSKHGGFLRPRVKLNQKVSKNHILGEILNIDGSKVEDIKAPHDGIVYGIRTFPSLNPGEWTFFVGKFLKTIEQ